MWGPRPPFRPDHEPKGMQSNTDMYTSLIKCKKSWQYDIHVCAGFQSSSGYHVNLFKCWKVFHRCLFSRSPRVYIGLEAILEGVITRLRRSKTLCLRNWELSQCFWGRLTKLGKSKTTEMRFILCTWFGEFCSCCSLTALPGSCLTRFA